ncbi:MAG: hypothetical protein SGPRY_000004 [Prymnesium sp.]
MRLGRDARVVGATLRLLPIFPSVRMAPPSMVRHACLRPLHPPSLLMTQPEPYDDAVKALRTQLQLDPSDASLHFEMAGAQMRLGKTVDAACSLRRSISLGGVSERLLEAYHEIAEQLMREGVCEEAESCWRQCLEIEPHNLGVKERLAATLRANGNRLEAADHLHDLIGDLDGSEEEQSWMYLDLGSVIDEVSPLAGVGPEWVEHCERGSAEVQSPTLEVGSGTRREELSAEACFRRAIQLDPSNGEAHKRLADLLVLSHGPRAAHAEFEIASQLLPDDICCATHCFYASSNQSQSEVSPLPLTDAHGSSVPIGEEGLSALNVPYDHDGWAAHAASTFEQHGAVVLNQLLSQRQVEVLLDAVNEQITCPMSDFTSETRNAEFRVHKALPVHSDACDVLNDVLLTLWPLLSRVLQSSSFPLIGSGFMCVGPGASEQELHKDYQYNCNLQIRHTRGTWDLSSFFLEAIGLTQLKVLNCVVYDQLYEKQSLVQVQRMSEVCEDG